MDFRGSWRMFGGGKWFSILFGIKLYRHLSSVLFNNKNKQFNDFFRILGILFSVKYIYYKRLQWLPNFKNTLLCLRTLLAEILNSRTVPAKGGLICQFSMLLSVIISLSTISFLFPILLSITFYRPFNDIKHCRHWPLKCIIMYFDFGVSGIQCLGSGLHFILNFACELMWKVVDLENENECCRRRKLPNRGSSRTVNKDIL